MAGQDLLIEIGLEEIPASFIEPALEAFAAGLVKLLDDKRIGHGAVEKFGTPRRLALLAQDVAQSGEDKKEVRTGPPKAAAFDKEGNPTKAALGFAKGQGVEVEDLQAMDTPKGEYLAVEINLPGQETKAALAESLEKLILTLPFPKSMRWGAGEVRFARPIHWLVVLLGDEVVELELAGQKSGRTTFGHRFMAPEPIELASASDYLERLAGAMVVPEIGIRKEMAEQAAATAAKSKGGFILPDPELVSLNANLVEIPSAVCGGFDQEFLALPDEVLITAMREHQKYFAVTDKEGRLLPLFVAINNTKAKDPDKVRQGHQRVLRARLADAAFFFTEDTKKPLGDRVEELKGIVYQKLLGTSHQKMERFQALTAWLAERLAPESRDQAMECARLAKADLVSLMVGEFPTLQGVVGRAYALKEGLDPEIADGIRDHYQPVSAEGGLPGSICGALVGLADKMDTIAGMFAINKPPTGGADPFALRRAALGIIRILIERGWAPSLDKMAGAALEQIPESVFKQPLAEARQGIAAFFRARMQNLFTSQGFDHDAVDAVLSVAEDDPAGARARIAAVQEFKRAPEFEEGAIAFKRVFNILKNQAPGEVVDPGLFQDQEEKALHAQYLELAQEVREAARAGEFDLVLARLAGLKPAVDGFFDAVMVMAEEETLRSNRLALVNQVASLFRLVADFSRLQTAQG